MKQIKNPCGSPLKVVRKNVISCLQKRCKKVFGRVSSIGFYNVSRCILRNSYEKWFKSLLNERIFTRIFGRDDESLTFGMR